MKRIVGIVVTLLALAIPQAWAGLIPSDAALKPSGERERLKSLIERPEVAQELRKMGLSPRDAEARVQAMSDAEVAQLAGRLDALPAGGVITNEELLLIIIIILLVALLL